jgi:Glycosyl hydrolases family 35
MASITFDGQSFMLDGRRVWLVSGTIPYARVPRAYWGDRIAAARNAGLNCIATPVIWARHEPRQGHFDWSGDNDLRHFVQLVGQAGMYCIIRPGPFADAGHDLGGLPPWLLNNENVRLRTANAPFLEACSRYITALAGQLRDQQVNSPVPRGSSGGHHTPGPIVLVQNESGFTCGDDVLAQTYLLELDRYFREAGFSVPIINANELWQSVEGEIDGWTGFDGLLPHLRQLGTIRPAQPRMVIDFRIGVRRAWNQPAAASPTPGVALRRMAEVMAAGGQFNLAPFHGGTHFGFGAGRDPALGHEGFLTTSADAGAPLNELGQPGTLYPAVRRICTFASRFSRVLSHLDPARQPVALLPEAHGSGKNAPGARVSVLHCVGSQGGVAFVFGDDIGDNSAQPMSLLLPDGSTLPVDLGHQSVVWCLLDTRLTGRASLDYCNLCAFALVGKVLVCFGPEGARAMLSINGAPFETEVPGGDMPLVAEHEGVTLVIASDDQLDRLFVDDHAGAASMGSASPAAGASGAHAAASGAGVLIGVLGIDRHGKPIVAPDTKSYLRLDADGKQTVIKHAHAQGAKPARATKPSLDEWSAIPTDDYQAGTSPRFASINKPADLVALGAPYGYGWYRIKFTSPSARKAHLMFPQSGHRLHVWLDGEDQGIVGAGPGAQPELSVNLKKGPHTLVVLAENFGRSTSGSDLGELTGLYGHAWEVDPIKPGKPKLVASDPVDVLAFRAPLWRIHRDDTTDAQRLTWKFEHRRKTGIAIVIGPLEGDKTDLIDREDGIVLFNGKPIHYFQQGGQRAIMIDAETVHKGMNEVQVTMVGSTAHASKSLEHAVKFYELTESPTIKGDWAFAKWEPPASEAFHKMSARSTKGPTWFRSSFNAGETELQHVPLVLEMTGLTKGQIYVNGRHVSRYFTATGSGKKVPPQTRYVIPRAYLAADGADELVIFDEHGHSPSKCRLLSDPKLSIIEA